MYALLPRRVYSCPSDIMLHRLLLASTQRCCRSTNPTTTLRLCCFSNSSSSSSSSILNDNDATNINTNNKPGVSLHFTHPNNSIAILTLQNIKRKNALTVDMMKQLEQHVETLIRWSSTNKKKCDDNNVIVNSDCATNDNDDARVLILTGANGTFCSGLDLHDNNDDQQQVGVVTDDESSEDDSSQQLRQGINMIQHMTKVTNQLHSLPVLSICAVDGYAVGGGAELTTCTDLVVLGRNATIQFLHAKRGASFGWGGGRRLVQKVGRRKALRMLLLGECVYGEEEARQNPTSGGMLPSSSYADAVANEGESALNATMRYIQPILDLPCSQSIRAIKNVVVSAADGDREVSNMAMRAEMEAFLSVWEVKQMWHRLRKRKIGRKRNRMIERYSSK